VNDEKNDSGRVPRCVEAELSGHLVDTCVPGDIVNVSGIVKVITSEEGWDLRNQNKISKNKQNENEKKRKKERKKAA